MLIRKNLERVAVLCRKHRVERLVLFGSATGRRFKFEESDLDFIVQFPPLTPSEHADAYFGLMEDLEDLFHLPIDLIELKPIRNPYFLKAIQENQVVVYEAA